MNATNSEKFFARIDAATQAFSEITHGLTLDQLNLKPAPDAWSMAQIIDHIIVINKTYEPMLQGLHKGTFQPPFHAKITFLVSFFGDMILKGVHPSNRKKTKTFPIWEPTQSDLPNTIMETFRNHQETLKSWIKDSQNLMEKGAVIHSPASKIIVYTLEKAFDIIVTHEERHLVQAQELKKIIVPGS